ncbi:MAG: hypothetical protein GKR98_06535 [Boseongicola sp.]|nr:MAG: hypothetical protein GKR98_06535 [Boseongicola sp.]
MTAMQMTKVGETDLVVIRRFAAPPERVYAAHTDPVLLQKWMLDPDGWSMPECVSEPVPEGAIRFTWANDDGESFSLAGKYVSLDPPNKIIHLERFVDMDVMADTHVTTEFQPDGDGTKLTLTIRYENADAREGALSTGMADGMAQTYDRLDALEY